MIEKFNDYQRQLERQAETIRQLMAERRSRERIDQSHQTLEYDRFSNDILYGRKTSVNQSRMINQPRTLYSKGGAVYQRQLSPKSHFLNSYINRDKGNSFHSFLNCDSENLGGIGGPCHTLSSPSNNLHNSHRMFRGVRGGHHSKSKSISS